MLAPTSLTYLELGASSIFLLLLMFTVAMSVASVMALLVACNYIARVFIVSPPEL
jgi:hypothetical protein